MSKSRVCRSCGHYIPPGTRRCPDCGGRPRSLAWLWWLLVFVALAGGASGYVYYLVTEHHDRGPGVELTESFIAKVQDYRQLAPFSEGMAAVNDGNGWGYINASGDLVIPCRYDHAAPFCGGVAQVRQGRRLAYITANGTEVDATSQKAKPSADPAYRIFNEGGREGKYGIADQNGKVVVPALYDSLSYVSDGVAVAVLQCYEIAGVDVAGERGDYYPVLSDATLDTPITFLSDSAIDARTVHKRVYGYIDLKGKTTFSNGVIDACAAQQSAYRQFRQRQRRLEMLEQERRDRLESRRLKALNDSLEAVIAALDDEEEPADEAADFDFF